MKPATIVAFVIANLIALLHVVRLFTGVTVVVGGVVIPVWLSALGAALFGALSFGVWREHAGKGDRS
jgi:hypothetical protein